MNDNMTQPIQMKPPSEHTRIIVEIEVATLQRLAHLTGKHCPFNECFQELMFVTRVCEAAVQKHATQVSEHAQAEAATRAVKSYIASEEAKKPRQVPKGAGK